MQRLDVHELKLPRKSYMYKYISNMGSTGRYQICAEEKWCWLMAELVKLYPVGPQGWMLGPDLFLH